MISIKRFKQPRGMRTSLETCRNSHAPLPESLRKTETVGTLRKKFKKFKSRKTCFCRQRCSFLAEVTGEALGPFRGLVGGRSPLRGSASLGAGGLLTSPSHLPTSGFCHGSFVSGSPPAPNTLLSEFLTLQVPRLDLKGS